MINPSKILRNVYLDYNAHTPCNKKVIQEMNKIWEMSGNSHFAGHFHGLEKEHYVMDSLTKLSDVYGCFEDEIIFTSGATEANNLAIFSGVELALTDNPTAKTILTSHLEHPSVLEPLKSIADKLELQVCYVDITSEGLLDLNDLQEKLNIHQVLWGSFCSTNGVIGTNQPIEEIIRLCKQHNVVVHTDGSQSGYLELDFGELGADYLTLSAHKIYGPSGIGLMISRHLQNSDFNPQIIGGGQQNGLRAGTLSVPLIVGFATAVEVMQEDKQAEAIKIGRMRDYLLDKLQTHLDIKVHGSMTNRQENNLHIAFDEIDAMQLLNNVQPHLSFSLDTACNGFNRNYSSLMKAMSVSQKEAESSVRISVGRMTTYEEIDFAVDLLVENAMFLSKA